MIKTVVGIFLAVYTISVCADKLSKADRTGYYWRDFEGEIPYDAVPGGIDERNYTTYIGQTLHRRVGVIVPGKISSANRRMYFEFDRIEHEEYLDVKILCSANQDLLEWVKAKYNDLVIDVVHDRKLVIGGHDRPKPVAIGRKWKGNELQLGKVLIINDRFEAIHMTKNGRGWQESDNYEILVYDNHYKA